jgi:hypothetical protein
MKTSLRNLYILPVLIAGLSLLLALPVAVQAQFTYETLDDPLAASGSGWGTFAFGISGSQIVGSYFDNYDEGIHGFLYNGSIYSPLDNPNSGYGTIATGISGGNIVGWYVDGGNGPHGFLYTNGNYTTLDDPNAAFDGNFYPAPPPGGYGLLLFSSEVDGYGGTIASGIDGGNIVGWYTDANGFIHGFLYNGKTYTTLDDPNGLGTTYASGISGGNIVGWYTDAKGLTHGFLYNGKTYTTLDDPHGVGSTYAQGISGTDIVGWYVDSSGDHGFLYNGTTYTTLDDPNGVGSTFAQGISGNTIVGWYIESRGNQHGFTATLGNPQAGSLQVTIAPAGAITTGAQWQVDGGPTHNGGATVTNLLVGYHTVSFANVIGWITPTNQIVFLIANSTVTAIGTYVVQVPLPLPNGTNGLAYSQQLSVVSGQPPYNWALVSGFLPSGLTLATSGLISGKPTTNGTFNFTVKVTDALSASATQDLTLTVVGPPSVTIQPTNNPFAVTVGNNVCFAVSVTGAGPFSYQWQLNGTNLPNGIITTVAGNGKSGYLGDRGAATNAELSYPSGVAVDDIGSLFIADCYNNVIRKVSTNGIINTVAGNGYGAGTAQGGYSGDGGAATNAELFYPSGVAVDTAGNLFIADSENNVIRKVGTNGIITTVAGNGKGGYLGDGGAATNAELTQPADVAVDATGNLFIADCHNNVIRKVGTNGIITTVAGNGKGGYLGDGGAATNAEFDNPNGVAVDTSGNLFIADWGNSVIRKVGTNGIINTVAGNGYCAGPICGGYSGDGGAATNAELFWPSGVAVEDTGSLFIADSYNNVIRKVGTNGIINTVAGNGDGAGTGYGGYSGDGGAATNAELFYPSGVAVDTTGNLFIADSENDVIRKVVIQGPTLCLNDVGFGNAGAYDVVVSSPYGSVTSSVVNLTVTLPGLLSVPQITADKAHFTFLLSGPAGSNYVLQVSTNLLNWRSVSTSTMPVSGTMTMTNAMGGCNRGFYRVYLQ